MSKILHRVIGDTMPAIVSGSGLYLHDVDGRVFVDATGGAAVACLGHAHPKVLEAMQAQMQAVSYVHSGSFTTPIVETLGQVLAENAPDPINHTYLVSGGSEAVESALKLARQYHVEAGAQGQHHFIARHQSYHGNTFGALSASGHPARRRIYEPMLLPFHHVDLPAVDGVSALAKRPFHLVLGGLFLPARRWLAYECREELKLLVEARVDGLHDLRSRRGVHGPLLC
jgi:adenosylmethionine-8-amino-7-oxononanoate aminotransferase